MLCDDLEGDMEKGGPRGGGDMVYLWLYTMYICIIYLWLIHVVVWQKPIQPCKAIILQIKFF